MNASPQIRNAAATAVGIQVNRLVSSAHAANGEPSVVSENAPSASRYAQDVPLCKRSFLAEVEHARRRDSLPEYQTFRDTGCSLAPSCLSCPLPHCRYDVRGGMPSVQKANRDECIRERRAQGQNVTQIAAELGVTRRTVFRALAAGK